MNAKKWLNCRLRDIQAKLVEQGQKVSLPVISRLLKAHDYRLRVNHKEAEGSDHPERARQFAHIHDQREAHVQAGQPCLSVDTKQKELVGNFKNAGRIWCQEAEAVNIHDFPSEAIGRAVPYGIYDLRYNQGSVYVGQSADTPEFVPSITWSDGVKRTCANGFLMQPSCSLKPMGAAPMPRAVQFSKNLSRKKSPMASA